MVNRGGGSKESLSSDVNISGALITQAKNNSAPRVSGIESSSAMSRELRQRIEDAFRSVRAAGDAHERERILGTLSPEVRREVEALLTQAADAMTMAVSGAAIAAGAEIGQYRIEARVGEGGMGTVYRALDT